MRLSRTREQGREVLPKAGNEYGVIGIGRVLSSPLASSLKTRCATWKVSHVICHGWKPAPAPGALSPRRGRASSRPSSPTVEASSASRASKETACRPAPRPSAVDRRGGASQPDAPRGTADDGAAAVAYRHLRELRESNRTNRKRGLR